jgi:protein associated with RNAse G/E
LKPGDIITVHALHADGQWYRRWQTTVESVDEKCIVTYSPSNSTVEDFERKPRIMSYALRSFYWFDKFYNLIEVFDADGALVEIYINIASAPQFVDGGMVFTDHELDVLMSIGSPAIIVDEDEFEIAIARYGYTPEFVTQCRAAVEEARLLAEKWPSCGIDDT